MTDFKPVQFVDTDARSIEQEMLVAFQQAAGQQLFPGDPRRIFLSQLLPIVVGLRNDINFTGNSNLLPFAYEEILDHLGLWVGSTRLQAASAHTTIRFSLSNVQLDPISIPKGTRVTPDGDVFFATISSAVIPAGDIYVDVEARSSEGGEKYNGYAPGQIKLLVDPIPYIASVSNLDTSSGGTDEESDDAFRERQRLAPASFSVAGPEDAYRYFAKSADVNIIDVAVVSPAPNKIEIYPLMEGGELPDQNVIDKVLAEVTPKNRRPLNDLVSVQAPTEVSYSIELTYYISKDDSAEEASIREAVEGVGGAADAYETWQSSQLGRAITPDNLISRIYGAGAYRVVTTAPVYTEIEKSEVAKLTGPRTLIYGGLI
ncbi:baseplate assembly protein [Paenibacillus antibioticophila]|uniref:baseplate assembly protein n=1 Tax=Paenibacillus antibioticophila TaxID=1274374 RepID=UPI0005C8B8FF|nr:baseplate J/gp47 family protein [Paenibacillus antibioticophila]